MMTLEGAIKSLKIEYEFAKIRKYIKNPLAYALYQVWKRADKRVEKKGGE